MFDHADRDEFKCEECGEVLDIEESIRIDTILVCEDCYRP